MRFNKTLGVDQRSSTVPCLDRLGKNRSRSHHPSIRPHWLTITHVEKGIPGQPKTCTAAERLHSNLPSTIVDARASNSDRSLDVAVE